LIAAVKCSDADTVRRLAQTKRVLNGRVDYDTLAKWTALHECVREKSTEMLQILLQSDGVKVDITDGDSETPLFVASTTGNSHTVTLLLQAGANANAKAKDGWSCLMMAARAGDYEITKALLEAGAPLHGGGADMFGRGVVDMVNQMRTGQGVRMKEGESLEQARAKYDRLLPLLSEHA
jgi:hypothetical protein